MSLMRQCRGGKTYDAAFGKRFRGEGVFADLIAQRFQRASRQWNMQPRTEQGLNTVIFARPGHRGIYLIRLLEYPSLRRRPLHVAQQNKIQLLPPPLRGPLD